MAIMSRNALSRLAVGMPKTSPHEATQMSRLLQRTLCAHNGSSPALAARALSRAYAQALASYRSYATTAPATKPTATVKKAVKATARATTKTTATKKAAPARKTSAKSTAKSSSSKTAAKKPKAKKVKKAKKKAAPKKKPATKKRVLTPEEKETVRVRELRRKALKAPVTPAAVTGFLAYIKDKVTKPAGSATIPRSAVTGSLSEAARAWKTLPAAEHEHWNHVAVEQTSAKRAQYDAFIKSHPVEVIREANLARSQLRRMHAASTAQLKTKRFPAHTEKLIDDRHVVRPKPYALFTKARWATGDFKNIPVPEASKLVSQEWKALSPAEKKTYEDMANQE